MKGNQSGKVKSWGNSALNTVSKQRIQEGNKEAQMWTGEGSQPV